MNTDAEILGEIKALRKAVEILDLKVRSVERLVFENTGALRVRPYQPEGQQLSQVNESRTVDYLTVETVEEGSSESGDGKSGWSTLAGKDIANLVLEGRKGEKLLSELIRAFAVFSEVQAIAVGSYLEEICVSVLTRTSEHYNYELTGRLIEEESKLQDRFEPLCLSVSYPEVGEPELLKATYNGGKIVWRRGSEESE